MVVFEDSMSVTLALKAADEQLVVEWRVPESDGPIGLKGKRVVGKYVKYNCHNRVTLQYTII